MDPESGLDAVRHVGIRGGKIEAVSETPLTGVRVIDASRHVVSPGFIDLHEHGQQEESYRMMVRDGVTSAFELEVGTGDVAAWYAARDGGQIVNYGVSVGHIPARMKVLGDPGKGLLPAGIGGSGTATDAQMAAMEAILREGLAQGAVAMGFGSAYTPGRAHVGDRTHVPRRGRGRRRRPTSTCAAGSRDCRKPLRRPAPRTPPCTSSMSTRPPTTEIDAFLAAIKAARDAGPGCDDRSVSVRRGHDGDPVGAVRRLADLAGCAFRIAPTRRQPASASPALHSARPARPAGR